MTKSPSFRFVSISATILIHSASGNMASYCPAMSKSCKIRGENEDINVKTCWIQVYTKHFKHRIMRLHEIYQNYFMIILIHSDITTYTLIKLPVPSSSHCRVVSSVHFRYVVSFNVSNFIHSQIPSKWYL